MISKIILSMLITAPLFCAEQKTPETSTLIRPATPGAPKSHHRHLAITIDRDSPIQPMVLQQPDIGPNRLKLKIAVVGCVSALVGAGISATVSLLSKKC
jgi:hypothetical protein